MSQEATLNASQHKAVTHKGSHLLIVAGPGTGKTRTLIYRIIHHLSDLKPNQKILAVTFTNRAAQEMKERLGQYSAQASDQVTVATFHSFCLQFLRENYSKEFQVATALDIDSVLNQSWPGKSAKEYRRLLKNISHWKSRPAERCPPEVLVYNEALREYGLLDFDDLVDQTVLILSSQPQVLNQTRQRYPFIFVDEYQDINASQNELLKLMVADRVILTAIGDLNQAIYGFRGSDVRYFENFQSDFPGTTTFELTENYRSAPFIIEASGQIISKSSQGQLLPLVARIYREGHLTVHEASGDKAEAQYIVHQIEKLVGGTSMFSQDSRRVSDDEAAASFNEIAVLYRLNSQKDILQIAFEQSGIPYHICGDQSLVETVPICHILTFLKLASQKPVALSAASEAVSFIVEATLPVNKDVSARVSFEDLAKDHSLEYVGLMHELKNLVGVDGGIKKIKSSGLWKMIAAKDKNCEPVLGQFERLIAGFESLEQLLDTLSLQKSEDWLDPKAQKVMLMTLHASKGLEFSSVFIAGCEDNLIPLNWENKDSDKEEERRLLYVGMTRAKTRLFLTHARRRMLFGRPVSNGPSPFLRDIEQELKAYESALAPSRKKRIERQQMKFFEI